MPPALVSLTKGVVGILTARRRAGEFLAPVRGKPFPQPFFLGYRESETSYVVVRAAEDGRTGKAQCAAPECWNGHRADHLQACRPPRRELPQGRGLRGLQRRRDAVFAPSESLRGSGIAYAHSEKAIYSDRYDRSTFYGFDAHGYTDYPAYERRESNQACCA